jgi:hypothetical protein
MELGFSRKFLVKMARQMTGLLLLFISGIVFFACISSASDLKRVIGLGLVGMAALITLAVIGKFVWLLRSRAPAAAISGEGVAVHSFLNRKTVPWREIAAIELNEMDAGRRRLEVIEIRRKSGRPVRVPLLGLADEPAEIAAWVTAARARLAA